MCEFILPERSYGLQPVGILVGDALKSGPWIGETCKAAAGPLGATVRELPSPSPRQKEMQERMEGLLSEISAARPDLPDALCRIEAKLDEILQRP